MWLPFEITCLKLTYLHGLQPVSVLRHEASAFNQAPKLQASSIKLRVANDNTANLKPKVEHRGHGTEQDGRTFLGSGSNRFLQYAHARHLDRCAPRACTSCPRLYIARRLYIVTLSLSNVHHLTRKSKHHTSALHTPIWATISIKA